MSNQSWCCPKCRCVQYETGQFAATGGLFSKLFDVQNKKFRTVSCSQCGFTEVYKARGSAAESVLDFFVGG